MAGSGNGSGNDVRRNGLSILPSRAMTWVRPEASHIPLIAPMDPSRNADTTLRVLLVEDNPGDATLVTYALRSLRRPSFGVVHASTLRAAIEHVQAGEHFDVVLLDLSLPDSTGMSTLARMQEAVSKVPIVIMTGMDDPNFANYALEAGAQDYLVKSDDPERTVARAIRYAITRMNAQIERDALTERIVAQQASLMQELAAARAMQFDLLPRASRIDPILDQLGLHVEAGFEPSSGIGGDLWGCLESGPDRISFYTFDFSGHGIGAALNVFRLHALISDRWDPNRDPSETLSLLGVTLNGLLGRGQFATMFLCTIDTRLGQIQWSAAGAPAPLLLQDGRFEFLNSRGIPLGLTRSPTYTTHCRPFAPGSALFLYSDAIPEAHMGEQIPFGEERLMETMVQLNDRGSLSVEAFLDRFYAQCKPPLDDDLTALLITRTTKDEP